MTARSQPRRRRYAAVVALATAAILGLPGLAAADPVTYHSGNGATATLSSGAFAPGDRIEVSGTGFAGKGGSGYPVIAIKLNDGDQPLAFGGPDAIDEVEPGLPSFEGRPDGTFSGWVDLPEGLPTTGPGTGDLGRRALAAHPLRGVQHRRQLHRADHVPRVLPRGALDAGLHQHGRDARVLPRQRHPGDGVVPDRQGARLRRW